MAKSPEGGPASPPENSNPRAAGEGREGRDPRAADSTGAPKGRALAQRKGQYLIAARQPLGGIQPMGFQPLQFSAIEHALRQSPDIEVVDTVGAKNVVGALGEGMGEAPSVLVARMTEQNANILHQQGQGRLVVERDQYIHLADPSFQPPPMVSGVMPSSGPVLATVITVVGRDNAPLPDAEVYLFGSMLPGSGVTDQNGQVTLSMFGETAQSIRGLYVKPKADYWSFYQRNPDISTNEANIVGMRALADWPALADFPRQQAYGWGQKAMRLDQLPATYRGQGIKVAVIDSGAATSHGDLNKIRFGFDIVNKKTNPATWNEDSIGHGSHCAGLIAGADNAYGVRGFAPDAEVHACKLFPGGQISQLIDALEYCIEKQVDVVNLSLGGAEPSEALEQQILRAKRAGIACIVAAGNSGGPVQYPASSPNVLAVSAIGKLNEFPPDSYHAETVSPYVDANGMFAAKFSCYGPQVAVCGPGVAIVSSVPANNFAAWDGTSMAAPHITGLAALVLAHHPDFQGAFKGRGPERVERLFQIIKMSARPVNVGDASRTGFGLPDVLVAVGLQAQPGQTGTRAGMMAAPQSVLGTMMNNPVLVQSLANRVGQIEPYALDPYAGGYLPNWYAQAQLGAQYPFGMAGPGFGRAGWYM
ncbi:MAG: S8 family serine peptidase [Pseudomonadota bacterium]